MALQLRITIILVTILATCWQLSSTLAASLQTDQEKVLVLAAAQQQQSQWQSGAATSSTTNNNDNDNGLSTILMKKMRPTTEWLLNNNVTRDYLGASVCSLVLTPFLTMEFLEQVQDVPIATITPSRDQVLVAASSAFLLWMASSTIPITFSPIILRVCTSLWARSCMFIIAFLGLLAFMTVLGIINQRWCFVAASAGRNPPAAERPRPHPIKATVRPIVKLDDSRGFVQHSTFDCMNVRADVYDYCSEQRIKMWGEERFHYHSNSLAVEMSSSFGG
ncbi:hypothetical protein Vafri_17445 [Volvox africanus]|nr:hypothetical protein Vafri_17445 [Volvox africanus]GIL63377.1 hypothetical protein Vafri_17445 [Volvox africanus]GIL63378.1 hypothetical protein Vafri_17445 [Volvox africanus]GIL63379.1 hypothetical protein Vafri_17445 [Volvox africanus]GIL63391.1 hypothetical protein Vafri_17445 [Volvox africanus]